MELVWPLLQALGAIGAVVGVLVGFTYWLFKLFSEKWLTAKFAERLADYKHSHQKELENVRFEINKLMDRTTKLHQMEFDALPKAWALLVEAQGRTSYASSSTFISVDVERMNEQQLDEFLEGKSLENWQKETLKSSKEKNRYYSKIEQWHKIIDAKKAIREYENYRLEKGILMLPEIRTKFQQMSDMILSAVREAELELGPGNITVRDDRKKLETKGPTLMDELEAAIRERLWS